MAASNHLGFAVSVYGTVDPSVAGVAAPLGTIYQRKVGTFQGGTRAGELWLKTAAAVTAWTKIATVPTNAQQSFAVTPVAGSLTFLVALPVAQTNNGYLPQVTMCAANGSANAFKQFRVVFDTQTVNDFTIEMAVPTEAGDVFNIFIPGS